MATHVEQLRAMARENDRLRDSLKRVTDSLATFGIAALVTTQAALETLLSEQ